LAVRADGFATADVLYEGKKLEELLHNTETITLSPGNQVELRLRLPEGMELPKDLVPEVYFKQWDREARAKRGIINGSPNLRSLLDELRPGFVKQAGLGLNMIEVRSLESGAFSFRLAADAGEFMVGIHRPGFLQQFDAGPFTAAAVKDGTLTVEI